MPGPSELVSRVVGDLREWQECGFLPSALLPQDFGPTPFNWTTLLRVSRVVCGESIPGCVLCFGGGRNKKRQTSPGSFDPDDAFMRASLVRGFYLL